MRLTAVGEWGIGVLGGEMERSRKKEKEKEKTHGHGL